ncbi:hypothetical protein K440DRAFT_643358 [Wilcoxina mikolae CBS 423.85]|nr:hypothetical protein K440DRAFT_643358 [Wilcoxina mikolae CBS 423.85]
MVTPQPAPNSHQTTLSSSTVSKRVSQILRKKWIEAVEATAMNFLATTNIHKSQSRTGSGARIPQPSLLTRADHSSPTNHDIPPTPSESTWLTPLPTSTLLPWYHTTYPTGLSFPIPLPQPAIPSTSIPTPSLRRGDKFLFRNTLHFFLRSSPRPGSNLFVIDSINMGTLQESRVYVEPGHRLTCPHVEYNCYRVKDFEVLQVRREVMVVLEGEGRVYLPLVSNVVKSEMVEALVAGEEVEVWVAVEGGRGYVVGWQMKRGCGVRRCVGTGRWRWCCFGVAEKGLVGEGEGRTQKGQFTWRMECGFCVRREEGEGGMGRKWRGVL